MTNIISKESQNKADAFLERLKTGQIKKNKLSNTAEIFHGKNEERDHKNFIDLLSSDLGRLVFDTMNNGRADNE